MALADLIQQIRLSAQKEINTLEEEASLRVKKIDKDFNEKLKRLKEEKERKLQEEKEALLKRKQEERKHEYEMKILAEKNKILDEALKKIKENLMSMDFSKKRRLLKKEIEEIKDFIDENTTVFIPRGKRELIGILKEAEVPGAKVIEQELPFGEGFLIENRFVAIEISLEQIIDSILKNNKANLANALFRE